MTTSKFILVLIAMMVSTLSFGQTLKSIRPTIGIPNNYSKEEQIIWQSALDNYSKTGSGDLEYEKLSSKEKALIDSLEMGIGPLTQGPGCSWYCGGQMYKVTSNSYLQQQGNFIYKPNNIHDFDLLTAWVPDTTNGVIGKKINFHFKPLSPRVNEILIYNGYIKNYELFKANSRVKKLKLYFNGIYYATLELADTTAQQSFKIIPTQSKDKRKDLIMTFEIVEIYKGDKYLDVALSEINFSGLDTH
jgi:hypothetical protein